MKEIATYLLLTLLLTGVLVSGLPVVFATTEGSDETVGNGDESSESETEPEPEPEAEPQPETEPQPKTEEPVDNTCQGGPPGLDGCPPLSEPEPEPKTETSIHPCLLDPSDPVCPKPGPNQDCPEGYAQNEDGNCFLLHPDGCPTGYHGHEDDETGRCIPNSTPCESGYEFNKDKTNCEKEHFTCDGKPSVVPCKDGDGNGNGNHNGDHNKKIIIVKKIIKNIDIINKIDNANSDGDLDVDQTIVAINYDEGAGINCVFDDDDNGQCETFDVNKDSGKEPLLQIIDFS